MIGIGKQLNFRTRNVCAVVTFRVLRKRDRVLPKIDSVIRAGVKYTYVLNEISAAGVIERGRLGVSELFTYHPREHIFEMTMIP